MTNNGEHTGRHKDRQRGDKNRHRSYDGCSQGFIRPENNRMGLTGMQKGM